MTADQIRAAIAALQALLHEQGTDIAIYPKIEVFKGVRYTLLAPLNPLYEPGMYAQIFGSQGDTAVHDPSNGDELGAPVRSPAGFPLFYAIGLNAEGQKIVIGTPSVTTEDHQFNSDTEALDYIKRRAKTPKQLAAEQRQWAEWGEKIKTRPTNRPTKSWSNDGTVPSGETSL